jgi:hypothetical protein
MVWTMNMKTKWLGVATAVAMAATLAGAMRLQSTSARPSLVRGSYRPVDLPLAGQLPRGFTLPSADANLPISSLITADLDADGDLDIVAADRSNGGIGIVVWVNDGAGRLTRKAPAPKGSLASEPAGPSIDERQTTVMASVQPDGAAIATIGLNTWLTLPARLYDLPRSADPESATPATLRSRSPPARS